MLIHTSIFHHVTTVAPKPGETTIKAVGKIQTSMDFCHHKTNLISILDSTYNQPLPYKQFNCVEHY